MDYIVTITPTAEKDLTLGYQQIAEESPQNAINCYLSIIEAIESLNIMAKRCPIAPESEDIKQEIRHLIVGRYRVLYTLQKQQVKVLHVRHSRFNRVL